MMRPLLAPVLGAFLFVVGCASSTNAPKTDGGGNTPDGMQQSLCKPGATQSCFCLGAGQGTQVCRADGQSYGSCGGCDADGGIIGGIADGGGNPCGNCDGCCNGTTCVTYQNQSNTECGVAGTTCGACSGGQVCDGASGMCVTSTNGCTGCGNGCCGKVSDGTETCFVNQPAECGTGGGSCNACAHGTLCESGACDNHIDPQTQFRVVVSKVVVYNTTMAGGSTCWDDILGGCYQPDIYVCFSYPSGGTNVQGCTNVDDDVPPDNGETDDSDMTTDTATYGAADGTIASPGAKDIGDTSSQTFYIPGSQWVSGNVIVTVYDQDEFGEDTIGSTHVAAGNNYYTAYAFSTGFGRVVNVYWSLE